MSSEIIKHTAQQDCERVSSQSFNTLLADVRQIIENGRKQAYNAVEHELIKADNPYLMGHSCFNTNCPNQPFTSQEGLIISPNIDIVKAWIDLYLFVKDELK